MRDDRERLLDIQEAIERIEKYTVCGREAFEQDELIQTWVLHLRCDSFLACGASVSIKPTVQRSATLGHDALQNPKPMKWATAVSLPAMLMTRCRPLARAWLIDGRCDPALRSAPRWALLWPPAPQALKKKSHTLGVLHHLQVIGESVRALSPELTRETFGSRLVENRRETFSFTIISTLTRQLSGHRQEIIPLTLSLNYANADS